jgi:hypothetical protein
LKRFCHLLSPDTFVLFLTFNARTLRCLPVGRRQETVACRQGKTIIGGGLSHIFCQATVTLVRCDKKAKSLGFTEK